jgi:hypothetical protein
VSVGSLRAVHSILFSFFSFFRYWDLNSGLCTF